jgi:acyl-CoA thioesterase FadM
LFHGARFQRIGKVWSLAGGGTAGGRAVFSAVQGDAAGASFPSTRDRLFLLGDPYLNDALLQSTALLVPQDASLPVGIDRFDIYDTTAAPDAVNAEVRLEPWESKELESTVVAVEGGGRVYRRLSGCRLQVLKHYDDYPTVADLLSPAGRDRRIVEAHLHAARTSLAVEPPLVDLASIFELDRLDAGQQRHRWLPLLERIAGRLPDRERPPTDHLRALKWSEGAFCRAARLPERDFGLCLAFDERHCVCAAGQGSPICDILPLTSRGYQQWTATLGQAGVPLLERLVARQEPPDLAGSRIEGVRRVISGLEAGSLSSTEIIGEQDKVVLFRIRAGDSFDYVLSVALELTWGPTRIFSLTVAKTRPPADASLMPAPTGAEGYHQLTEARAYEILPGAPQGQEMFVHRLPVGFRPSAQLSRKVYFSHFLFWLGEARETSVWPVLYKIADEFGTGKFGNVTNHSRLRLLGEASACDRIEIRTWISGNRGSQDATMEGTYDFRKVMPDGSHQRLALCVQETTWVKILDQGRVQPIPYPDYYRRFIKEMLPRDDRPNLPEPLPEPLADSLAPEGDAVLYRCVSGPKVEPRLHSEVIETSLADANLVGNVYFAHYFDWQGRTRDRYFYRLVPDCFTGIGEKGELICLECQVDHLREAMPFDRIIVTLSLKQLGEFSAVFHFEYFKETAQGGRIKLATGEQTACWAVRDLHGNPLPASFPAPVIAAFKRAIEERT